jgi:hypothetical protein
MAEDTLLVTAGDVIDVQLTSETVVIEDAGMRHVEPGHITNRMRLFVREMDGRERKYDFDDTELGVRETQRVAIVRGRPKRHKTELNLILFNLSSGESDTFKDNLAVYLGRTPVIGALGKAFIFSALVALITWVAPQLLGVGYNGALAIALAAMFALIGFPLFWWLSSVWDRVSERIRYRNALKRFIADMTTRVQAYAPGAAQVEAAPAAQPSGA